ncbi:hypothetical protein [Nostoc sp.]|uniref:hypothetical protein n=1 Tax=Nostoc sp. TaxID=1180 RepID=UPI002FF5075D
MSRNRVIPFASIELKPTACVFVVLDPIMVVYTDGVWYGQGKLGVIERIIQEHLIGNKVVEE